MDQAVAITGAQMEALEALTLDEYCTRIFRAMSSGADPDAKTLNALKDIVRHLASVNIRDEDDVELLILASWPRGVSALNRGDVQEILTDTERADWLRAMQAAHVMENARG